MNFKSKIFALSIFFSSPLFSMQAPPQAIASWDSLPKEIKLLVVPMIASSNVHEVTKTILALNHTNKFLRNFVQSEAGMLSILEHMPYTANAVSLVYNLRWKKNSDWIIPIIWGSSIRTWWRAEEARLTNGKELLTAIARNDLPGVRILLGNKNIHLNYNNVDKPNYGLRSGQGEEFGYKKHTLEHHRYVYQNYLTAVGIAVSLNNSEMARLLIKAGARPNFSDTNGRSPLAIALANKDIETARLILAYGGNPNTPNFDDPSALRQAVLANNKEMIQLLLDAGANIGVSLTLHDIATDEQTLALLDAASAKSKKTHD